MQIFYLLGELPFIPKCWSDHIMVFPCIFYMKIIYSSRKRKIRDNYAADFSFIAVCISALHLPA